MIEVAAATLVFTAALVIAVSTPAWLKRINLYWKKDSFECVMCGNCCRLRYVEVTDEDMKRLKAAGEKDFLSEDGRCLRRVGGRCVFNIEDRCSVYEHRPTVCKKFPFFSCYGVGFTHRASFCPALEELRK